MSAGRVALLGLLALTGGCMSARANVCPDLRQVADLYAVYEVVAVEKYRGGLTSRVEAAAFVGQEVELSVELFRLGETTITQPRYEIRCHPVPVEGEVTTDRWSSFYGYGIERRHIEVLDVYATTETHPDYRFEVIGPRELWRLYDGWLYRLHARGNSGDSMN
jgi:hypothetical protein